MPTISIFFGIAIRMYFDEHRPPHFHAYYGGDGAALSIATLEVTEAYLPRRALALGWNGLWNTAPSWRRTGPVPKNTNLSETLSRLFERRVGG